MKTTFVPRDRLSTQEMSRVPEPEGMFRSQRLWKGISEGGQMQRSDSAIQGSANTASPGKREYGFENIQSSVQEEILGWWTGTVTAIQGKTFTAEIIDLDNRQSLTEIERRAVGAAQQGDIQKGARFVYSVSRKDEPGGARTESAFQFIPPYIWSEADASYVEKRVKELYKDDSQS
jgi:hypothetical protein